LYVICPIFQTLLTNFTPTPFLPTIPFFTFSRMFFACEFVDHTSFYTLYTSLPFYAFSNPHIHTPHSHSQRGLRKKRLLTANMDSEALPVSIEALSLEQLARVPRAQGESGEAKRRRLEEPGRRANGVITLHYLLLHLLFHLSCKPY
jgi:hypothetical protein